MHPCQESVFKRDAYTQQTTVKLGLHLFRKRSKRKTNDTKGTTKYWELPQMTFELIESPLTYSHNLFKTVSRVVQYEKPG